ncbi:cation:proton antiporter [Accumulibacter sp.]|uniref:cation:proton antiporter domain-containing protein n=1 Tax=Accumulibacter sp. TaxID=2053492 RepID=UPI0025D5F63B|nr:cation:proton antiporter [Accumulibacter sp.]MCM8595865.1 cation:proton antiporter [Accumulibacter sp.]MDS4050013.1 cation:proton antiporter [Accumulibacter sp.]
MDPKSFVYSAVLLLVVASIAVAVFRHFGLGSILGLLVAGVVVGPHTPGPLVTTHVEDVRHFTELGVVLLLFLIGLEMKPRRLWDLRRTLFGLGSLQIVVSTVLIGAYLRLFLPLWSTALLLGASFALSSTAFVVQMLRDQGEIASRHGQTAFAVLLMQDLAVVPLLALVPILAEHGPLPSEMPLWEQIARAVADVALVVVGGRYVVPRLLDRLARQNNREAFFLAAMAAVFAAAWAMDDAGMSMALGAFLIGMLLSTSRYSLQIEATMEPHKGLLMSLFFVAVGMSIDLGALAANSGRFALHVVAIVLLKIVALYLLCLGFGTGRGTAVRVAFLLSQSGEFGFVVFGAAKALGVIDDRLFVMSVAVISLTMLLTPLLARLGNALARHLTDEGAEVHERFRHSARDDSEPRVVIGGYGRVGHAVGTILASCGIRYLAFETDAQLVARWRSEGHPVFYGDIGDPGLLGSASLQNVDLVVLTIDDRQAAVRAATLIRSRLPEVTIVARARDLVTCDALLRAGVTKAFPETLEASLRLAAESLESLGIPSAETEMLLRGLRSTDYALVRVGPESNSPERAEADR